jgi:hypothetical protein
MVTVAGLAVPLASPPQEEKVWPVLGVAVRVTVVPVEYLVESPGQFGAGFGVTDPPPAGLEFVVSVKQVWVKFASTT